MCSARVVPVSGSIPTACAKRNTTWAGVAWAREAPPAIVAAFNRRPIQFADEQVYASRRKVTLVPRSWNI